MFWRKSRYNILRNQTFIISTFIAVFSYLTFIPIPSYGFKLYTSVSSAISLLKTKNIKVTIIKLFQFLSEKSPQRDLHEVHTMNGVFCNIFNTPAWVQLLGGPSFVLHFNICGNGHTDSI